MSVPRGLAKILHCSHASALRRAMANTMSGDALFQIESALAEDKPEDILAALSCKQIMHAVLAGVSGKHWCSNFIKIAKIANQHGKQKLCCSALLAELIVAAADASDNGEQASANNSALDNSPAGACAQGTHGTCAAVPRPLVGTKRACTMPAENGNGAHGTNDGLTLDGHLASLVRSRDSGPCTEHLERLVARREHELEQMQCGIVAKHRHPYHGKKIDAGHLSVRNAYGAGGKLTKLSSTQVPTACPRPNTRAMCTPRHSCACRENFAATCTGALCEFPGSAVEERTTRWCSAR